MPLSGMMISALWCPRFLGEASYGEPRTRGVGSTKVRAGRRQTLGLELRQYTSIDLIGFDLGVCNEPDLLGVGDNDPADVRCEHCGNRSRIAGGFDDDNVAVGQLLGKFLQRLAAHDDATQPAELAVFPGHRLGKSAVNIQSNDPHTGTLRS